MKRAIQETMGLECGVGVFTDFGFIEEEDDCRILINNAKGQFINKTV